ncbi:MAG TPA: hypothetical protein VFV54_06455 [Thermoanaerobaculia bacterium]|nr:hypothetical protein [Thermoanaerobaculia bacterium]
MSDRVAIHFEAVDDESRVRCTIDVLDASLHGHGAELRIRRTVLVKDDRPVNESDVLFERKIESLQTRNEIVIHRAQLQAYTYRGSMIDIAIESELEIDDGVIIDTTIREQEELLLGGKPAVSNDAKGIIEPADAFDFLTNFKAIPPVNKMITAVLLLIGGIVISVNTLVGIRDQFKPDGQTLFYDHRDSDGDSESPLQKSLVGSGMVGAALWFAIRRQLRKYMTFEICNVPGQVGRAAVLRAGAVLRGRARIDLHNVRLRIVACNMERGQYTRGSGTKKRTVSFKQPVRAVVLYDQEIPLIPAGAPVESYFSGEIAFEPLFKALYPPQKISGSHGLAVYWEVQLIHDELVDQELIGPVECFAWKDFLEA